MKELITTLENLVKTLKELKTKKHEGLLHKLEDGRWAIVVRLNTGDVFDVLTCAQCDTWREVKMEHNGGYHTAPDVPLEENIEARI